MRFHTRTRNFWFLFLRVGCFLIVLGSYRIPLGVFVLCVSSLWLSRNTEVAAHFTWTAALRVPLPHVSRSSRLRQRDTPALRPGAERRGGAQLWMSAISSPSEPGDNQQEKSSNPPFCIFCPTWRVDRKKAIEWTRRYLRSTGSFSATDLLKIYFKKRKRKQIRRRSAGSKQIILDIERSGACGYWLSSFPSASWMVGDVLIKLKFPYIGVQIFTSDNVRHVCVHACIEEGERMSSLYTGWSFCFLFSVNIWQFRFKTFYIA